MDMMFNVEMYTLGAYSLHMRRCSGVVHALCVSVNNYGEERDLGFTRKCKIRWYSLSPSVNIIHKGGAFSIVA